MSEVNHANLLMSIKLRLTVCRKHGEQSTQPSPEGDYLVALRTDTPESCLASAAFDAVLCNFPDAHGEDFNVKTRDLEGHIVLDTELPAYGAMRQYGLSVTPLP